MRTQWKNHRLYRISSENDKWMFWKFFFGGWMKHETNEKIFRKNKKLLFFERLEKENGSINFHKQQQTFFEWKCFLFMSTELSDIALYHFDSYHKSLKSNVYCKNKRQNFSASLNFPLLLRHTAEKSCSFEPFSILLRSLAFRNNFKLDEKHFVYERNSRKQLKRRLNSLNTKICEIFARVSVWDEILWSSRYFLSFRIRIRSQQQVLRLFVTDLELNVFFLILHWEEFERVRKSLEPPARHFFSFINTQSTTRLWRKCENRNYLC